MNTLISAIESSKSSTLLNTSILSDSTNTHINILPKLSSDSIQNTEFLSDEIQRKLFIFNNCNFSNVTLNFKL